MCYALCYFVPFGEYVQCVSCGFCALKVAMKEEFDEPKLEPAKTDNPDTNSNEIE